MTAGHELAARTEHELAARVIDTLLREGYADLSQRVRLLRQGNSALHLPAGHGGAGLVLPLERDGFLADLRIRRAACPQLTMWTRRWQRSAIHWTAPGSPHSLTNAGRRWLPSSCGNAAFPASAPGSRGAGTRVPGHGAAQAACSPTSDGAGDRLVIDPLDGAAADPEHGSRCSACSGGKEDSLRRTAEASASPPHNARHRDWVQILAQ